MRKSPNFSTRLKLPIFLLLLPGVIQAEVAFYVDPDFSGNPYGTAEAPFRWLDLSAWDAINAALAGDSVRIYYSARQAGQDVNQASDRALNILRTDLGQNQITFDGKSKYNSNDSAPSWSNYSGSRRFEIRAQYPVSTVNNAAPYTARNRWTLQGFSVIASEGQPLYLGNASNVLVQDNEFTALASVSHGPAVVVASPGGNFGSHIILRNNHVHHTYGEGIYVGGFYGEAPGFPGGDDLLIENNKVHDVGFHGGEPDCIDIKDGWTNVTVKGNLLFMSGSGAGRDGVVTNSAALIEDNFIYNMGRDGITLDEHYSNYDGFWTGAVIRGNVVVRCGTNPGYSWGNGINLPGGGHSFGFIRPQILNNTVVNTANSSPGNGRGINISSNFNSTADVRNNIVVDTDGIDFYSAAGKLGPHSNNLYHSPGGGVVAQYGASTYTALTIAQLEPDSLSAPPLFLNPNTPYSYSNFGLQGDSPACGRDMGALPLSESCGASPPSPPTGLRGSF